MINTLKNESASRRLRAHFAPSPAMPRLETRRLCCGYLMSFQNCFFIA
jgi:hypothetical protein